ncbi:MAG: LUD domain-containing protein [Bacteroidetes bacterium]|nr:LUD domain-containing protein [Bacteroidota bacterium]
MQSKRDEDLIKQFIESAKSAAAFVELIPSNAESLNNSLIAATGNEMILLAEPDDLDPELFSIFKLNKNVVTEPTKEQISNIKTGITDAFCAIANTGSVCVSVTKNLSSPASMLTRQHIVIIDVNTIVQKPRDVFSDSYLEGKGLKRSFSIITGPSATADMGPLVRGVHGPGKLHIIILD